MHYLGLMRAKLFGRHESQVCTDYYYNFIIGRMVIWSSWWPFDLMNWPLYTWEISLNYLWYYIVCLTKAAIMNGLQTILRWLYSESDLSYLARGSFPFVDNGSWPRPSLDMIVLILSGKLVHKAFSFHRFFWPLILDILLYLFYLHSFLRATILLPCSV